MSRRRAPRSAEREPHGLDAALDHGVKPPFVRAGAVALVLFAAHPALADISEEDSDEEKTVVVMPTECAQFWTIPGGPDSPVAWDTVLSFAACIQDDAVARVEHVEELESFVEALQVRLEPSLQFYLVAIEEAPGPVKLRAAYYIGLGQVALTTRTRASVSDPKLRVHLEPLLAPHLELAYKIFVIIEEAAQEDPHLVADPVARNMVRSAREHARVLREAMPLETEQAPLVAQP